MNQMPNKRSVARDITYAYEASGKFGRSLIRGLENATGRIGLIKRADGYAEDVKNGADFWELMYERYGLELNVIKGALENIPSTGPVIVVSNHPYGILDGLSMGLILKKRREEFKIMANRVFRRSSDLDRVIIPISFEGSKEALTQNMENRKAAMNWLKEGGIIGIFPGATVSTSHKPFGKAYDPSWHRFPTKLITRTDAVIVPIYFPGSNSRLFQLASHIHSNLRLGLLIREFRRRIKKPVDVCIGAPISRDELEPYLKDATALKAFLRKRTYAVGGIDADLGYEFNERYRDKAAGAK